MLESALIAGLMSVGIDALLVGVMPKPAIAFLTKKLAADIGIFITASHNLYQDNGFLFFDCDGHKLSDEYEKIIEDHFFDDGNNALLSSETLGQQSYVHDAEDQYIQYILDSLQVDVRLDGIRIALDCANGAGFRVAPQIFRQLGAEVSEIGTTPDGQNINSGCGSTNVDLLVAQVQAIQADIGIAFDGDADRVIFVDEAGEVIDNDQVLALLAQSWKAKKKLCGGGVVSTVLANLGLSQYLEEHQLQLARTAVGDRYVVEHMRANGYNLGGDSSGHFVFLDFGSVGDGILASLQVLSELVSRKNAMSQVCERFDPTKQLLVNARFKDRELLQSEVVREAIAGAEKLLDGNGRLLIRMLGVEPIIRVMGEGYDEEIIRRAVDRVLVSLEQAGEESFELLCRLEESDTHLQSILSSTVSEINKEIISYIKRKPGTLFELPPRKFEELIASILKNLGWRVDITQQSKDGGYDIFAVSKDVSGLSTAWVVECKRYAQHRKVGVEIVRSLFGTPVVQNGANALLVATSSFTKGVRDYKASRYNLELRDFHGVLDWVNAYNPNPNGKILVKDNKLLLPD